MAKSDAQMRREWANAFAEQSRSDFGVYQKIAASVEECHRLHYLQMAGEKIAKAYRLLDTSVRLEEAMKTHVAFSHIATLLVTSSSTKAKYEGKDAWLKQTVRHIRSVAREIERLAPSVDRDQSPANAEYPWLEGENVAVPCQHSYSVMITLQEKKGLEFLKLMQSVIDGYFMGEAA